MTDPPRAALDVALDLFTQHELSRLLLVEATMAAEQDLVLLNQQCRDHLACRRLAFGLWLRLTRVSEGIGA